MLFLVISGANNTFMLEIATNDTTAETTSSLVISQLHNIQLLHPTPHTMHRPNMLSSGVFPCFVSVSEESKTESAEISHQPLTDYSSVPIKASLNTHSIHSPVS